MNVINLGKQKTFPAMRKSCFYYGYRSLKNKRLRSKTGYLVNQFHKYLLLFEKMGL